MCRILKSDFKLSTEICYFINRKNIEEYLSIKLGDTETMSRIEAEILSSGEKLRSWLDSESSQSDINEFLEKTKDYLSAFVSNYISTELPTLIDSVLFSEDIWNWFGNKAMPTTKERLTIWLKTDAIPLIKY